MFATCSDDTTVCLWDLRNMSRSVCILRGHTNWVKNVEYVSHSGLLVTSGFDGNINLWDINRCGIFFIAQIRELYETQTVFEIFQTGLL